MPRNYKKNRNGGNHNDGNNRGGSNHFPNNDNNNTNNNGNGGTGYQGKNFNPNYHNRGNMGNGPNPNHNGGKNRNDNHSNGPYGYSYSGNGYNGNGNNKPKNQNQGNINGGNGKGGQHGGESVLDLSRRIVRMLGIPAPFDDKLQDFIQKVPRTEIQFENLSRSHFQNCRFTPKRFVDGPPAVDREGDRLMCYCDQMTIAPCFLSSYQALLDDRMALLRENQALRISLECLSARDKYQEKEKATAAEKAAVEARHKASQHVPPGWGGVGYELPEFEY